MSASTSAEKSIPENNLLKRSIIGLDRFNLSDEDLHNIRIHVAVFKYNNPRNNSSIRTMNDKRNQLLPFKRKLLKNSMKNKACDDNLDEARSFKRSCNRYQGVGNFPTVHLNKTPVVCRPIKRNVSSELQIQYPELPTNRFINHVSESNLDLKSSSTRSVLDVLQDLSRKRIHSKDDADSSESKSKGLGGDVPLDLEAPYKPLFVQKLRNNSVSTKDSTTQTQDLLQSSEQTNSTNAAKTSSQNASDPKAELRRKLAKQNNEIFASLSSSMFSPFSIKRKLGKSTVLPENSLLEDHPVKKRPKLAVKDLNLKILNDAASKINNAKALNLELPCKAFDKRKSLETSPKPSRGRDRLMNIYFDMQNGNPKADIFRNSLVDENNESVIDQPTLSSPKKSVSFNEEVTVLTFNNNSKDEGADNAKEEDKSTNSSSVAPSPTVGAEKDAEHPSFNVKETKSGSTEIAKPDISSPSTAISSICSADGPVFNFKSSPKSSVGSGFKIPLTTTVSSPLAQNPIFSTGMPSDREKIVTKSPEKPSFAPFNFGSPEKETLKAVDKQPDFGAFKFVCATASSEPKETQISSPLATVVATSPPSFSVLPSPSTAVATATVNAQKSVFGCFALNEPQTSEATTGKLQFTFGQSSSTSAFGKETSLFSFGQQNVAVSRSCSQEITSTSSISTNTSMSTSSLTPVFGFGPKMTQNQNSMANEILGNNRFLSSPIVTSVAVTTTASSLQSTPTSAIPSFVSNLPQNNAFGQNQPAASPFAFGQKPPQLEVSSVKTDLFGAKSQPNFTFTFGQKTGSQEDNTNSTSEENAFGSKAPASLFSFGKTSPENPAPTSGISGASFGQTASGLETSSAFGRPAATQATPSFGSASNEQTSSGFGLGLAKPQPFNFGQNNSVFGNPAKSTASAFSNPALPCYGIVPPPGTQPFPTPVKPTPTFGQTGSFFNRPPTTQTQTQAPAPAQPQPQPQPALFGSAFNQNPNPASAFSQANQFSFGSSSSSSAAPSTFATAPPVTTAPVFGFNSSPAVTSPGSTFGFGNASGTGGSSSSSSGSSTSRTPFAFGSQTNEHFKFGATPNKETPNFISNSTVSPFSFGFQGANNNNNNSNSSNNNNNNNDPKPGTSVFSFGNSNPPNTATPGFNFGGNTSSSVFNFANSGSSTSSNSTFSFGGTPQPNQNPFGQTQTPTPTPSPFSIPGTFSIGTGSSQTSSRPRVSNRLRRRP